MFMKDYCVDFWAEMYVKHCVCVFACLYWQFLPLKDCVLFLYAKVIVDGDKTLPFFILLALNFDGGDLVAEKRFNVVFSEKAT